MCLDIAKNFRSRKKAISFARGGKRAKQDIVVYKVFSRTRKKGKEALKSVIRGFVYERGKKYTAKFSFDYSGPYYRTWALSVEKGLHSWNSWSRARQCKDNPDEKIVRCIIPKGARYFKGNNNDLVSNQLIITKPKKK